MIKSLLTIAKGQQETASSFARVKRGYEPDAVDAYLQDLEHQIAIGAAVDVGIIRNKHFTVVKRGYDRVAVHRYLDQLASSLEL